MAISSSNFFKRLNNLETARKNAITALAGKGVDLPESASFPAIVGAIEAIPEKEGHTSSVIINTSGQRFITVAELPNTTFSLYDEDGQLLDRQTTNTEYGGVVVFSVVVDGVYNVVAENAENVEMWTNSVEINGVGQYNCKTAKSLNDYTWPELKTISENAYGEYMFECDGLEYKQTNFMSKGATSDYSKAYLVDITDEGHLLFSFLKYNTSYKHYDSSPSNINGISWVGSSIRTNCLEAGEAQYIFDLNVTAETTGTYYVYDTDTNTFVQVSLPEDYDPTTKYYTRKVIEADGAFIASIKEQVGVPLRKMKIKTWGGYGAGKTSSDNTIIETQDYAWLPSDSNIFGHKDRWGAYSKFELEGRQFKAFEKYRERIFWGSSHRWLRSPYLNFSNSFCYWYYIGYVTNHTASNSYCAPVCFCL